MQCPGGPVRVRRKRTLRTGNVEAWGLWEQHKRTIWIAYGLDREQQWRVFYHELMHVCLTDSGLENSFPEKGIETLCDAVAAARIQEHRGNLEAPQ